MTKGELKDEIIEVYQKYVVLLTQELEETVPIAHTHGWKSKRFLEGKQCRDKINDLFRYLD